MFQDYSQEFELKIYILKNVSVSVFKELSLMEGTQTRLKIEYIWNTFQVSGENRPVQCCQE